VPVVTGLAPDPRQPGYRLLEVDRGRFASLPAEQLAPLRLEVGTVLERRRWRGCSSWPTPKAPIAPRCANSPSAPTRAPTAPPLAQKQHPPAAVDAALERLATRGLLDDTASPPNTPRPALAAAAGPPV